MFLIRWGRLRRELPAGAGLHGRDSWTVRLIDDILTAVRCSTTVGCLVVEFGRFSGLKKKKMQFAT